LVDRAGQLFLLRAGLRGAFGFFALAFFVPITPHLLSSTT